MSKSGIVVETHTSCGRWLSIEFYENRYLLGFARSDREAPLCYFTKRKAFAMHVYTEVLKADVLEQDLDEAFAKAKAEVGGTCPKCGEDTLPEAFATRHEISTSLICGGCNYAFTIDPKTLEKKEVENGKK